MLFWIFVIALALGVACLIAYDNTTVGEWCSYVGMTLTVLSAAAVLFSLIVFGVNYTGVDGYIAENQVRYDSLVYQYKNDLYDNENDLGKKELMNQIQEWNEDLARKQKNQRDFWIGIYIPDIYDQFDFIDLENPGLVPIKGSSTK